jgi:hypothetical protein
MISLVSVETAFVRNKRCIYALFNEDLGNTAVSGKEPFNDPGFNSPFSPQTLDEFYICACFSQFMMTLVPDLG